MRAQQLWNRTKRAGCYAAAFLWRRMMFSTRFIAITGSVGKTTTKELLAAILGQSAPTVHTTGTENTISDVCRTLLRARPWHKFVVVEVGTAGPGFVGRAASIISPDISIVLAVAPVHTDKFSSLDETTREKTSLVRRTRTSGAVFLNGDDARVASMAANSGARVLWFGTSPAADFRSDMPSSIWPRRLAFQVHTPFGSHLVQTQLVGTHWVPSVLAAFSVAFVAGVPAEDALTAIASVQPTTARLQPVATPSGAIIVRDDFNGSDHTFHPALAWLQRAIARRRILVVTNHADSPENSRQRVMKLAVQAASAVDMLVLVGRYASRGKRAVESAGLNGDRVRDFTDLRAAAEYLRSELQSGDLVLLRGRLTDHVARVFFALFGDIACWAPECGKTCLCDDCSQLGATPSALIDIAEGLVDRNVSGLRPRAGTPRPGLSGVAAGHS